MVKFVAWKWILSNEDDLYMLHYILLFKKFTILVFLKYLRPFQLILVQQYFTPRHLHYPSSLMLLAFAI